MDTETEDPDYTEWLSTIEAHCNCCRICQFDIPCGDVQTYLDILALRALDTNGVAHPTGIDLGQATIEKFNEVSRRIGCDVLFED